MGYSTVFNNTYNLLVLHAEQSPDVIAIEAPERLPLPYKSLLQNIHDIMQSLLTAGVRRNDRVAIVLPNGPEMALILLAVSAFAVSAPLNPLCQLKEFETYLSDLKVKYLITRAGIESPVYTAARRIGITVLEVSTGKQSADGKYQLLPQHMNVDSFELISNDMMHESLATPDDTAILLQTSGTTSSPKIVPLSHRNICVAVNYISKALALSPSDRCLSMMPQFHIGGFVDLLLAPLASGGSVVCTSRFNATEFFSFLKRYRPTWYQAVPATLYELIAYAERENIAEIDSSLRLIRSVASPLQPQIMNELEALFKVPVIETYGMTEAAPLITTNPLPPAQRKAGSVGKSVGPEVVIMDESGSILSGGEKGEVVIRGDNIISGYENNREVNDQTFRYGWFHTGDLGYLDQEGYLFLTGRLKELINRGGEKISPQEIDSVLLEHPAVSQAITFSIPHMILGEDIAAAVVLKDGHVLSKEELKQFVAERLSIFKVPRTIHFVQDIPKGPTGKIQRIGLSERLNLAVNVPSEIEFTAPRNPVETKIANIWNRLLKLDRVGINDNFFAMGGDSLRAVELFIEIEKVFNHTLPLYTIFGFSTIAELSKLIEEKEKDPAQRLLKAIPEAIRKVIFWIQCSFDPCDVPIIPFDTYWGKSPEKDVEGISIEEMAAEYIQQIRRYKDIGPYYLGGYSIGGVIALEVARQLTNAGEKIPLLFLIDPAPPGGKIETKATRITNYLKELSVLNTNERILYIKRRFRNFIKFSNFAIKKPICKLFFKFNKSIPYNLREYYAHDIFSRAFANYKPPRYIGFSTIYLSNKYGEIKKERWRFICPNADIHIIDTDDHLEMIKSPWDSLWLKELQNKLNEGHG